ncbi:DUF748 domain-containing protein [Salinicola rhizosphaerae]|uniref:DUF748 domain-containing protein n=1 Tax=Salinicola rhizosphaerae TaxID=1443141 RepID=A0ABQ3DWJ4_9GAMM|nr:DUF748 domain-containing protein [Salinicola rhizosphaerae]GHB17457.1 hypothetical protein GCM10009038_15290 [Salinicola rhizosphaerae]
MSHAARHRGAGWFVGLLLLLFLLIVVGPWALTTWLEGRFSRSLGEPVQLERVTFNPFTATAGFSALRVGEGDEPMIVVPRGDVAFQWSTLWQSGIHIAEARLDSPRLHLVSPPDGPLNVTTLGSTSSDDQTSQQTTSGSGGSSLSIDRIEASGGEISWEDRRVPQGASIHATDVDLTLNDYRGGSDSPMQGQASGTFGDGRIELDGTFGLAPFTGDLHVSARHIGAKIVDPWLTQTVAARVASGRLGLDGRLRFGQAASDLLRYQGQLSLDDVATVDTRDAPLISLAHGAFADIDYSVGDHLTIQRATLSAPDVTARIEDDGRFNLAAAMSGSSSSDASGSDKGSAGKGSDAGIAVAIKRLDVEKGRFDFEDRRISPTVSLDVSELQGQMSGLDTRSDAPVDYHLNGKVSDGTPVMIEGDVSFSQPAAGHLHLTTERLALAEFAPYIRRFAGYRIDNGSADLDLDYRLRDGTLTARNHIILKQLNLGKEVDPDETSLPLKNLIGLLQAESGVIDLDIPIKTTVDGSTQVDMSVVIWQALTESLENLVTSPIDSLQALIGGE